jgi:anti-anti-sigma regulatory factor
MAMISAMLRVDDGRVVQGLEEACQKLEAADGELLLDFSSVARLDPNGVAALKTLAGMAEEKAVKLVLRSVNVDVYKVLKLVKLSQHFSFVS